MIIGSPTPAAITYAFLMKTQFPPLLALFAALATASPTQAETIRVPADHGTIQGAIAAARDGDRIVVSAGTYRERIALKAGVTLVTVSYTHLRAHET